MQVVGRSCAVCGARIVTAPEGRACASCEAALHNGCADGHVCAGAQKPAAAAAPAPRALKRPWLYGLLGVAVAAMVVPTVRSWQTKRSVLRRVAANLNWPVDEVEVSLRSPITASGCGRTINYLRVCGDITRSECLEEIDIQLRR